LSNYKRMIDFGEIMKKNEQGLLHILGQKESTFWTFGSTDNSGGENEFEYQKNILFWAMAQQGFSKKDITIVKSVIAFLAEQYRNDLGEFDFRVSAQNPVSGHKEPEINHLLGVPIIALGILNEGKFNKKISAEDKLYLAHLETKQRAIVLAGMFHDFCEDKKGDEDTIRHLLKKLKFPKGEMEEIIETGQILTRRRGENFRESSADYIERITRSGNALAPFLKASDIVHNALSAHKNSQKKKYETCYLYFIFRSFTFTQDIFPKWLEKKIFSENAYLKPLAKKISAEAIASRKKLSPKY